MLEEDVEDIKEHPATIWKVVVRGVRFVQHRRRRTDDFPSGGNRSVQCRLVWLACFPFPGFSLH